MVQDNADGIIVINKQGGIRFANKAARKYLDEGEMNMDFTAERVRSSTGGEICQISMKTNGDIRSLETHTTKIEWEGKSARLITIRELVGRDAEIEF